MPVLSTSTHPELFCPYTGLGTELVEGRQRCGHAQGFITVVSITLHFPEPGEVQGD